MSEFQGAGGIQRLRMKLVVIIPWFLGVKLGEIEFENWRVGCVCKSFPFFFH